MKLIFWTVCIALFLSCAVGLLPDVCRICGSNPTCLATCSILNKRVSVLFDEKELCFFCNNNPTCLNLCGAIKIPDLCMLCGADKICTASCQLFAGKGDALVDRRQLDLCMLCGSDTICKASCQLFAGKGDAQLNRRQLCQTCGTFQIGCWGLCTNPGEVIGKRDCAICGDNARCALVCSLIAV
ncbi:unnamed protein product [Lymnaea stagnalis]|uniref:Uncharacterized protein n=1 Tax=Lymnaea stagnalis TaxID=6523 RepID=A0AAV2IIX1_LYMST